MARSRRVDPKFLDKVRLALKRNNFPTQRSLAEDLNIGLDAVSKFFNGKAVGLSNFNEICFRLGLDSQEIAAPLLEEPGEELAEEVPLSPQPVGTAPVPLPAITQIDWGEAPDVSVFYGRTEELTTLNQWITQDHCRLVAILGMGGMGKTTLTVKLVRQIQEQFEFVIWRSLRNAPPAEEIVKEMIQFLSHQQEVTQAEPFDRKVSGLLEYLRRQRCLLILDNLESVLQSGRAVGHYLPGYEEYGYLLTRINESDHNSCLIITTREKPREIAWTEGTTITRSLQLQGLSQIEGREIFKERGCYGLEEEEFQEVVEHYAGNPLALKMAASVVQELADGDASVFMPDLRRGKFQFGDINDLIERQFQRLSITEQQVMYWLAINRDPIASAELETDVVSDRVRRHLLEAIQSLSRRCLLEGNYKQLTLQPVVMEYTTYRLVCRVCDEIVHQQREFLREYALIKAQSKDYIRQAQIRLILQPILDELQILFGNPQKTEQQLREMLTQLQTEAPLQPGYVGGNLLNLLHELGADLSQLDCSYLTIWQAYLVTATLHQVNFSHADLSRSVFTDTLSATLAVAFSPDGQFFAAGNSDGQIRIWHTASGQKRLTLAGHRTWVTSIAFSPDGNYLASGSFDHTVKFWDAKTGQCLITFTGHENWVWSVRFSPDGRRLVSSGADRTIRLWDVRTGEDLAVLQGHTSTIWSATFSPDGQWIASGAGGNDRSVRLWDVQTGQVIREFRGHEGWVRSVVLTPDGQTLISAGSDQMIKIWDVSTGNCCNTLKTDSLTTTSLALSADGQLLASGGQNSIVRIWEVASGQCLNVLQGHPNGVWSVAFHLEGEILLSGSNDSTIKLWNIKTGQSLRTLVGYNDGFKTLTFNANQQLLATGGHDKKIKLWSLQSGECAATLTGHTSWIWSAALSRDGQLLASVSSDCTVRVWQVETGRCIHVLRKHTNLVMSVAFSPDDRLIASGSSDQTVRLWDRYTGECCQVLMHACQVWSVACAAVPGSSVQSRRSVLASGGDDTIVRLWDMASGECMKELAGHTGAVWSVAFSPSGRLLASGCHDQTIRIWDVQTGECLKVLSSQASVWAVEFSPDEKRLASGGDDKTTSLWDVETGQCLATLSGHTGEVYAVAFLEETTLATAAQDGLINIWHTETQELIQTLRDKRPYELMNITQVTGLTPAQKETLKALGAIEV